jgi:hypothetical protein
LASARSNSARAGDQPISTTARHVSTRKTRIGLSRFVATLPFSPLLQQYAMTSAHAEVRE